MKITIITLLAFALSLTLYSFAKPNTETFSLTIDVKNLRNEKGVVQFALYNKDGSIPDEDYEDYYKIISKIFYRFYYIIDIQRDKNPIRVEELALLQNLDRGSACAKRS